MSKYNALWDYVRSQSAPQLTLSFDEIQQIAGIPIDHSFLQYKKELAAYGWQVQKISMKEKQFALPKQIPDTRISARWRKKRQRAFFSPNSRKIPRCFDAFARLIAVL